MFLALREFRHAKLRYALVTGVIVLVASLVFILSGLANGLSAGNSEAIDAIPADRFAVAIGSEFSLDRSRLDPDIVVAISEVDGVRDAQPIVAMVGSVREQDSKDLIGVSVLAVPVRSFLDPGVKSGEGLSMRSDGVVIDQSMANEGIHIGDTLVFEPSQTRLTVVGITTNHQYRLAPTLFVNIDHVSSLNPELNGAVSAVALQGDAEALDAIDSSVTGVQIGTSQDIVQRLPGQSEQNMTLTLITLFLVVIAALVIAAFFFILTLQKMSELGVMKALGATTWELAKALMIQAGILAGIGVLVGIMVADSLWYLAQGIVPYKVQWQQMLLYGGMLLVVAVAGTLLSLLRIARIDPLDAINKVN